MFNELIILLILIFVSGFFSGSEIAFVVVKKIKIEIRARKKNIFAKEAFYFTQNPQQFFSTILIANNVANIAFASISTLFLASVFGVGELGILIISSFILLIFGELIPKYLARELSDRVVYISAVPLKITYYILYPFVKVMSSISSFLIKSSNVMEENISYLFNKEDIELLVKESHEAGKVNTNESDIITKVLELGKQRVHEAMKPRTDIVGVDINQNIEDALSVFIDSGYSKLPVYEENLDNIKGVIYAYDLFKAPQNLKDIMREVIFVPETKKSFDMLNEFLIKHVSIAIVIDEFGGTAGIITIEDVMEELFGEIKDEFDIEEDICRRIAPNTYIINGKVEIDFINEKYNLGLPKGNYETLGGLITYNLGRIPVQGESIRINDFDILIAGAGQTKIDVVKLIATIDPYETSMIASKLTRK